VLSYVPFKNDEPASNSGGSDAASNYTFLKSLAQRKDEQREISKFIDLAFQNQTQLTLHHYCQFNETVSSEMFTSLIKVLHESLPCAENYTYLKN
jgi:hypothetical protein